ncbi:MAG: hypothetical protein HYY00_05655 [Chloroflexi bacterium]|nr:hypothetical protein [Chloroflexota bacterium]
MITSAFTTLARARLKQLGMSDHPVVVLPHPIASKRPEEVRSLAQGVVEEIAGRLLKDR